ncbi:MerR family transcriptional regulator [Pseudomonas sp. BJa5]|uniref:MerR family transcriptional regulator n=1 Tax=Pseudomonas sp. BJa5 TaxID=2936270 RepID=UPI002559A500|nr:MerR family transcriptional regulator [Pseudomonas sp. BGr12]MDL2420806.1 MerR family transcriptional regulator [Pseudomonas sp. BGr12]
MYIGKAAKLSGATIKCIRHYEKIGLLPAPRRQGSYRVYDEQSVALLSLIKCGQKLGFSLKQMQTMINDDDQAEPAVTRIHQAISARKAQLQVEIDNLREQQKNLLAFETNLKQTRYDCFTYST